MRGGRRWSIGFSVALIVALVIGEITAASAVELDQAKIVAALQEQEQCFENKAAELDDRISDALTIGAAVAQECKPQTVRFGLLLYADGPRETTNRSVRGLIDRSIREAALTVLRRRSGEHTGLGGALTGGAGSQSKSGDDYDPELSREAAQREQLVTGVHLKEACGATDDEYSKCSAFVRGVAYAYRAGAVRDGKKAPYCLPERYFAFQWTNDVIEFLDTNPNFASGPAESAVVWAMKTKHPCSD